MTISDFLSPTDGTSVADLIDRALALYAGTVPLAGTESTPFIGEHELWNLLAHRHRSLPAARRTLTFGGGTSRKRSTSFTGALP